MGISFSEVENMLNTHVGRGNTHCTKSLLRVNNPLLEALEYRLLKVKQQEFHIDANFKSSIIEITIKPQLFYSPPVSNFYSNTG